MPQEESPSPEQNPTTGAEELNQQPPSEQQETTDLGSAEDQPSTEPNTQEDWEREKTRYFGKMSKLQKQLDDLTQGMDVDDVKAIINTGMTMESLAQQSPVFKDRVIELVNKARAGELTEAEKKELEEKSEEVSDASPTPEPDSEERKWIRQRMEEDKRKQQEEVQKTVAMLSEIEGDKKAEIDKETYRDPQTGQFVNLTRQAIGINARRLMAKGVSKEDAYRRAFTIVVEPEKLAEEGEISAMAQAMSTSSTGSPAGGKAAPKEAVTVPDALKDGYNYRLAKYGKERANKYLEQARQKI